MMYRVVVLPRAIADLEAHARWWSAHHSSAQAVRWLDGMRAQLQSLATFPERHALSAENDAFAETIRDKPLGLGARPSYRAVFTIRGDAVFVLSVRRATQDGLPADLLSD